MKGPPLGPGGGDITWPDQVAPRSRMVSSTRKIKPQTSNLYKGLRILNREGRVGIYVSCALCSLCAILIPRLEMG